MKARSFVAWLVIGSGWIACADDSPLGPAGEYSEPGSKNDDGADDDAPSARLDAGKSRAGELDASPAREAGSATSTKDAALDAAATPGPDARADAAVTVDASMSADAGISAGAGMSADAGGITLPPFPTHGEPLRAPPERWTYIEFPNTKCRDGSPAGLSVSLSATSKKLLLYLEGGGGCFDANTCSLASSANVDGTNLTLSQPGTGANINSARTALKEGIFDRDNAENPIRDWNIVYVPYCTGDTHAGTREEPVDVPGLFAPKQQWFVGQNNIKKFLDRIVPTFPDVEDVLLAGVSAGGYGTLSNLYLVQRAFPGIKVKHVNDSGAPLSTVASPECLQQKFNELWQIDLSACGDACPNPRDYTQANALWVAKFFADRPAGFIDTTEDGIISLFLGTGLNNCTGTFGISQVPAATYRKEVLAYADKLKSFPNYGAFTPGGTNHTYLRTNNFYTVTAGGVRLVDWFKRIIDGVPPGQARD